MDKYIKVTDKTKIKNPLTLSEFSEKYEGDISNFSFKSDGLNQQVNFEKIQESLIQFNTKLDYIWSNKLTFPRQRVIFVAKSTDNNFYWYKYEGPSQGSGQNFFFVKGNKIKLTTWISISDQARLNLWNEF